MELLKIILGLAVITVIVVAVGLDLRGGSETGASSARQVERSFASDSSSARFLQVSDD